MSPRTEQNPKAQGACREAAPLHEVRDLPAPMQAALLQMVVSRAPMPPRRQRYSAGACREAALPHESRDLPVSMQAALLHMEESSARSKAPQRLPPLGSRND